ncbi:S-layer homology domain-containing protein [Jeotgalibacillus malaysiensis]|uniref:S-layer homology domain-containing protein n=1 Tax=Jeotgalibacillus malaysiensis TaxID=1508404 RepID=UPI00384E1E4F
MAYQPKSYRKFLAGTVTTALVASAVAPVAGAEGLQAQDNHTTFTDVNPADVHAPNIQKAVDLGLVNGYGDEFRPYNSVTRGQVALILSRWLASEGITVDTSETEEFADVPSTYYDEELYEASLVLRELGIFTGTQENNFNPSAKISRQAMAKVLVEAFGLEDLEDVDATVSDIEDAQEWAREYINILVENGVTVVDEYRPLEYVTRAQFSTFAIRALTVYEDMQKPGVVSIDFNEEGDTFTVEFDKELPDGLTLEDVLSMYDVEVNGTPVTDIPAEVLEALALEISGVEGNVVTFSHTDLDELQEDLGGEFVTLTIDGVNGVYTFEVAPEPMVESVTAVNAKEVVVSFSTPLAKDTTDAELQAAFTLEGTTFESVELSEDRTTATYTLDSTEVTNAKVTVLPLDTDELDEEGNVIQTPEYNALLTYSDTIAPTVKSVEAVGTTAVINFSEPVSDAGTISLDGTVLVEGTDYTVAANSKSITLTGLTAGEAYTVDIVGAIDTSDNLANPIEVNFTVAELAVDEEVPSVSSATVSGSEITINFSEELAAQDLNGDSTVEEYATVTINGTPVYLTAAEQDDEDATKFTVDASSTLGTNDFVNVTVTVDEYEDLSGNAGELYEFDTTLIADTTAPVLAGVSTEILVADDTSVTTDEDVIYLTFSEPVTVTGTLTLETKDGVVYTVGNTTAVSETSGVDVDGDGEITGSELNTVAIAYDLEENSTYEFELSADSVSDDAGNVITATLDVDFTTGEFVPAVDEVTDSLILASAPARINSTQFTVTYSDNVTSSATNASNYTLGGEALPAGTLIQFINGTDTVRFILPEGSVRASGTYPLEITNVVDTKGNTLENGQITTTVELLENVAPTATDLNVVNSTTFNVEFSEAIQDAADGSIEGITVFVGGTEVTPATASVTGGVLTVTTSDDFGLTDSISVEFENTNLVDANDNEVQAGVVTN